MNQGRDKGNDKIRFTFYIDETTKALECYKFFAQRDTKEPETREEEKDGEFTLSQQMKIYYQKEEEIFEKYANEEAALYE